MRKNVAKMIEIDWKPDKKNKIALYSQIVSYFSEKVSKGDWIVGQKIPSQRDLARIFDVNRSTVVEAMEELTSMGLIEGRYGKGTFIVNDTWSLMMSYSTPNWNTYIEGGNFQANKPTIQKINKMEYEEGILRLGTGEMSPQLFPADSMKVVLSGIADKIGSLSYLPPLGLVELREALCKYLERKGIFVTPANILIVSGGLQALHLISMCILPPKSTVYIEKPSYLSSINVFQSAGIILEGVPMDNGGMMPWMVKNKDLNVSRSLIYTIPTFQNPTGKVMTDNRRKELLNYCKINKMPMVESDPFGDLWFDNPPPLSIKSNDTNGIVLYIGGVSKSLAPGLRIGWLVGPESVIQRLADVKMQTDYGSSSLSQWAVTEWLESGLFDQHLVRLRQQLKSRRDFMLGILDLHFQDLATWEVPLGSYYIWLKIKQNISANKIFEVALKENILLNPGEIYDGGHQYLRLSYAYESHENMEKGLIKLAEIIRRELSESV